MERNCEIHRKTSGRLGGGEGRDGDKLYLDKIMGIYRENKTNEYWVCEKEKE